MWFKSNFTTPAVAAISFCLIGGTTPAHADLGDQLFKLLPEDGSPTDWFGISIAISGVIGIGGAPFHSHDGDGEGSAYLFDTTTGKQISEILPSDGAVSDWFGYSVAISGATAIVGSPAAGAGATGPSAYLFDIYDPANPKQIAHLVADDVEESDEFGWSVGISGDIAIVGAPFDDDNGSQSGSAYLFDTTTGLQIAKLLPNDGAAEDRFGNVVGISGDTAIVGAYRDDDNGIDSGSAYLFEITTGQQIAKLVPDDGAADDSFGYSVAISGTRAIVGAYLNDDNGENSGSAYIFDITTGNQLVKLLPTDGEAGNYFGYSVAISGTTAIVGAPKDDDIAINSGSAYLFDITDSANIKQIAKLRAEDGALQDHFGFSVAISGPPGSELAIVSTPLDDDNGISSGSAYLFDGGVCSNPNPDAVFVFDSDLPYLSEADSPFDTDSASYSLENFEDGLFDIPGVSVSGGEVRFPSTHTDSVDMDDGVLDGFGTDGHSFLQSNGQNGITFTFDSKILNGLPSKVGLVWTDGNAQAVVSFTATDARGECLGFFQLVLGDDVNNGTTGEDRFLGLEFAAGINSVSISTSLGGIEVDHLQFVLPCSWDLDDSGSVGASDLLSLLASWGPCKGCPADLDGNGSVGASDLLALLANWGPCP